MRIERAGFRSAVRLLAGGPALVLSAAAALAADYGKPVDWQMGVQLPVTQIARDIDLFHDWLLWIITAISLFVLALLAAVVLKFNERANPAPSRTTHNTMLEVAWTVVPVLILVAIAIPSFRILREQLIIPKHDIVVKATGYSWYWGYEYPQDQGGFRFESNMIPDADIKPDQGQIRLLSVDNEMVVPVNKIVRLQVTAGDVLHAFAMPSFGLKLDAVPGRLNETWFQAEREGVYYGQCSELCGNGHPYMPITIRVVSEERYNAWLAEAKTRYARIDGAGDAKLAANAR
jgi:cytochrome c oxidase subunit II